MAALWPKHVAAIYNCYSKLMFIIIPTNAQINSIKLILKLLRHVSVFLHHPQGVYKFCQLKLRINELVIYNTVLLLLLLLLLLLNPQHAPLQ
jgi:hypothetical protein